MEEECVAVEAKKKAYEAEKAKADAERRAK